VTTRSLPPHVSNSADTSLRSFPTPRDPTELTAMTTADLHRATATKCAVFDLDGTLHPDTLGVSLLEAVVDDGLCDEQRARRFFGFLRDLGAEELRAPVAAETAYNLYAAALDGVLVHEVQRLAGQVWQHKRSTIFECMHPLISAVAAHAYQIVLISGSPEEIVREVALDLNIARYQGAVFSSHNSRYDGQVAVAPGISGRKLDILTGLVADVPVDLRRSMAIGNAAADIEILSAVGCPIAFEPSVPLREAAIHFGWPIADQNTPASSFLNALRTTIPPADQCRTATACGEPRSQVLPMR